MKKKLEFAVVRMVVSIIRILPLPLAHRFADGLAHVFYDWLGLRREVAIENIRRALPDASEARVREVASDCYRFFARAGVDWLKAEDVLESDDLVIEGEDHLETMRKEGGVIVSAHLGYWELAGVIVARRVDELVVYADRQSNPHSDRFIRKVRSSHGIQAGNGMTGIRKLSKVARNGGVAAVVGDQRPLNQYEFVPFFGREVKNTRIFSFVARKSKKPVYPLTCRRRADGAIVLLVDEPLPSSRTKLTKKGGYDLLLEYNQWLEDRVLETPEQYFWLHKRWKGSRPIQEQSERDTAS